MEWVFRWLPALMAVLSLGTTAAWGQSSLEREEIALERCDRLPVVKVRIDDSDMRFLVDTGATTMLNLRSFARGRSRDIQVTSWSGTAMTSAREVTLPELALGRYRLRNLKLPAIDLTPIGQACGGQIDGILGVDLLERMDATIDLERRVARLGGSGANATNLAEEWRLQQQACIAALNGGDSKVLEGCLDAESVLFTTLGEFRGPLQILEYLRQEYPGNHPPARFDMHIRSIHILGNAAWYEYDYVVHQGEAAKAGRGTSICRKIDGHWRLLNMHNSRVEPEASRR